MSGPPPLTAQRVAITWTGASGIPLAAAVCTDDDSNVPPVLHPSASLLNVTVLFRFLTGMQSVMGSPSSSSSANASSEPASSGTSSGAPSALQRTDVVTVTLPWAAERGSLLVSSAALAERETGKPVLRAAVLLVLPETVSASEANAVHRACLSAHVCSLLSALEMTLFAQSASLVPKAQPGVITVRAALARADDDASAIVDSYTARTVHQDPDVKLSALVAQTQSRVTAPLVNGVRAVPPPRLSVAVWSVLIQCMRASPDTSH